MDTFTHHCLLTRKLDPNSNPVSLLGEVIISYMDLGISVTLKIHVLFNHVLPALQYTAGRGLGHVSEQTGECAHQEFKNYFWSRYKVNNTESDKFADNLLRAVIEFSSEHL